MNLEGATREELLDYVASIAAERDSAMVERDATRVANERLKEQIAWFKRQLFGAKSEKLIPQDPRQGTLFEVPAQAPAETTSVQSYERSCRRRASDTDQERTLRFGEDVPVEEIVVLPKEVEGLPESGFEVIGEKVTERLIQTPAQFRVRRTIRKTVKLKGALYTEPAPPAVIERSFADVTFLVGMLVDKFLYHLPLYRQHQRLKVADIHISRGHMTRLVHRTLELLEPIYYAVLSSVTTSDFVSMDESPVKVSRRQKGKMHTAYFWPVFAEAEVAFVYQDGRRHAAVREILGDACKKLLSDGYAAYDEYAATREDFVHANCWAHARRYFFEARAHSPPECAKVLEMIGQLFAVERELSEDSVEILAARKLQSAPIVEELFSYLETLWFEQVVDRDSLLGKAVFYTREREAQLRQFLEHPEIPLSNNHVERAIRPMALGRKNWLFCWSEVGAKYTAIAYTLIECCKLHSINPWDYLVDVLQRIDSHPARDVHLLTPKLWKEHFAAQRNNAA